MPVTYLKLGEKTRGYKQTDIDAKVAKAYQDVFEGPNKVYFEVGDTMAYVSDVKNKDARTERLPYGKMVAVQLGKKTYSTGSGGGPKNTCITSLLFAANKWGNNTGINYYGEARRILDAMWKKDGAGNIYNLINTDAKQILFVPEGNNYKWTDPSTRHITCLPSTMSG